MSPSGDKVAVPTNGRRPHPVPALILLALGRRRGRG